jgi:membrane associated rhomboid family serine protease
MKRLQENTPLVLVLAIGFFGGLAAVAFAGGLFDRLGGETTLLLGAFAVAFAVLTYHLDPGVRGLVKRLISPRAPVRKDGGRTAAI